MLAQIVRKSKKYISVIGKSRALFKLLYPKIQNLEVLSVKNLLLFAINYRILDD